MTTDPLSHRIPQLRPRVRRTASWTALYSAFAVWGTLTVLRNLDVSPALLHKFTRYGLAVPNYRFFGPNPGTYDLNLLIRHRNRDGSLTEWQEVVVGEERNLLHAVWAPFRRPEKVINDAVREVYRTGSTVLSNDFLPQTTGYKLLLNVARNQVPHDSTATDVQFAVCQLAVYEPLLTPQITYVSAFHDLATADMTAEHVPQPTAATAEPS
ncbi:hypothetical protein [Streptomyces neyagawaensis]|uniref:hypothetical protein n=1 Tax=Streptomyces neyagawaensis TaxID=42238 RepID=UPI0006E4183D|nr:hypothetical protein [Streptomyces neyagawaensis]MCL6739297.1 hypothetical protein [Streptomyces neyagawaensis]MDE1688894.1 hypothetical protein [Streptomyces neyagawaensis]